MEIDVETQNANLMPSGHILQSCEFFASLKLLEVLQCSYCI